MMSNFMAAPIKVARPFSGNTTSIFQINRFLMSLDLQFKFHDISEDYRKIAIFAANLEGKAIDWFANFYEVHEVSTLPYESLVAAFKESFNSKLDTYDIINKLSSITQKGSIEKYIEEFNKYKILLPQNAISESILVDLFTKGLKPETRKDVRLRHPQTVYAAGEIAKTIEHSLTPMVHLSSAGEVTYQPSPQTYPTDADGDTIMAIRASTRSNGRGHSRGGRSNHKAPRNNGRHNYSPEGPVSNKDKDAIIRRICREYNLCFKC